MCFIMSLLQEIKSGYVYYLEDYTAPKVFNGLYFECLLTDQKIPSHSKIKLATGILLTDWDGEIYTRERFFKQS